MNIKHHATCHPIKWFRVKQNFGRREAFTNGTKLNTNVAEISNSFKIFISAINAQNNTKHIHASPRFITEAFLKKWMISKCFLYISQGAVPQHLWVARALQVRLASRTHSASTLRGQVIRREFSNDETAMSFM